MKPLVIAGVSITADPWSSFMSVVGVGVVPGVIAFVGGVMGETSEQIEKLDTRMLQRTADHLAERYAGVFSSELVERIVFESYATLARTAKVRTYLAPVAGHFAADRLAALAHAKNRGASGAQQVLFVDEHDTGPAQIAAALLAHHARNSVVVRSAGILPGTVVNPVALEVLAARGVEAGQLYPKPVTDDVVRAADWVITFGTGESTSVYPQATYQDWGLDDHPDTTPERVQAIVDELDHRVRLLWADLQP